MKKKVLITCWCMEIGGVERSLLGLLDALDYEKYEIDLILCRHEGEFFDQIPKQVNLLPEIREYTMFQRSIKDVFSKKGFRIGVTRIITKARNKYPDSLLTD